MRALQARGREIETPILHILAGPFGRVAFVNMLFGSIPKKAVCLIEKRILVYYNEKGFANLPL